MNDIGGSLFDEVEFPFIIMCINYRGFITTR